MKTTTTKRLLLPVLIVFLGSTPPGLLKAQTFTTLVSFDATSTATYGGITYQVYGHGTHPWAGLVLSGNTLYGTALYSTVFAVNTDGTGFKALHGFTRPPRRYALG